MTVQQYKISDTLSFYKAKYDWEYGQDEIAYRVRQNKWLLGTTDFNTTEIKVRSVEIDSIVDYGIRIAMRLSEINTLHNRAWTGKTWSYIQDKNSKDPDNGFHVHTSSINFPDTRVNAPILTDWTYCFYLQVPNDLQGNEGSLLLKDIDGKVYAIKPEEGDFIFFKGNVEHKPNLAPNSEGTRIAICSNISFNITEIRSEIIR
jgi:hypothetical protein